jgi:hypothetical protein
LVSPHTSLNVTFSVICEWIDLKFGRNFHVDLLFQLLLFFLFSFSSKTSSFSFSS